MKSARLIIPIRLRSATLIPIRPAFSGAIFDGYKTIEVRKHPINTDIAYLYETAPTSAITGAIWIWPSPTRRHVSDVTPTELALAQLQRWELRGYTNHKAEAEVWLHPIAGRVAFDEIVEWPHHHPMGPRYLDTDEVTWIQAQVGSVS